MVFGGLVGDSSQLIWQVSVEFDSLSLVHTMSLCLHSGLTPKAPDNTKLFQCSAIEGGQKTHNVLLVVVKNLSCS